MCETIAKIVIALIIGMTASVFIYQVRTTEKVGRDLDPCVEEYKDYCLNEGGELGLLVLCQNFSV